MCGWVGVFGACEPADSISAAVRTLASRGPDGQGVRIVADGPLPAALGHRRLAILDPSAAGAQPMYDESRGVSVVYNGEIYNSPELRRELQAAGLVFRSTSDTEVLLLGWAHWGDRVLDRIEGIFSFALLDERRGRVLLARDRLGVKPLYWAVHEGVLVAGSAPRAILSLRPGLRSDLDRVALAQFLTLLWVPHPRTPWAAIHKLAPGHAISMEGGHIRCRKYWASPPSGDWGLDATGLRRVLGRATCRQLLSDVPVGLLLSGGLDSSLLLALMAEHSDHDPIPAFTAGYDDIAQTLEVVPDDRSFAHLSAKRHPLVELTDVTVTSDAQDDVDYLAWHFDDPVADPAAITLHRLARASDVKVLLSGVGGEELFAGYPRHAALGGARGLARLPYTVRRAGGLLGGALRGGSPGPLYPQRRNAQKLSRALERRRPHYWQLLAQLTEAEIHGLMPDVAAEACAELDEESGPLGSATLASALHFDRAQFLPNLNLAYVDKAAMANGVEVRVPLLDETVVQRAFAADPTTFWQDGASKAPLRAAAAGLVDPQILTRAKTGFGGPVRSWARGDGVRQRVTALSTTGIVDAGATKAIAAAAASGRSDTALAAWALCCLEAWQNVHGL